MISIFISYCHNDEWLKDELLKTLAILRAEGRIKNWHDRMIVPGKNIGDEIDKNLSEADIFIPILSADFFNSNYCYSIEFSAAQEMHEKNDIEIVPVVGRQCRWIDTPLANYNAIPRDGKPVNRPNVSREQEELRDDRWDEVASGIERVISDLEDNFTPILQKEYLQNVIKTLTFPHPNGETIDFDDMFVQPKLQQIDLGHVYSDLNYVTDRVSRGDSCMISGENQSGKTSVLFQIQRKLSDQGIFAVIIKGANIRNVSIDRLIRRESLKQFGGDVVGKRTVILVDDVDDIKLPENIKKTVFKEIATRYKGVCVTAFSALNSALLRSEDGHEPELFELEPFSPKKVFELVSKWVSVGGRRDESSLEADCISKHSKVISVANDGATRLYPSVILMILSVISAIHDDDTAPTSNSAIYDAMLTAKIREIGFASNEVEQAKQFLGACALRIDQSNGDRILTEDDFLDIAVSLDEKYYSTLEKTFDKIVRSDLFIQDSDGAIRFRTDNALFFLCGRYLAGSIRYENKPLYESIVSEKLNTIHLRSSANVLVYIAFFDREEFILDSVVRAINDSFNTHETWKIRTQEEQFIDAPDPIRVAFEIKGAIDNDLINEEVERILDPEFRGRVVGEKASFYVSPFFDPVTDEVETSESGSELEFIRQMNALFRLQSIAATSLSVRAGTTPKEKVLETVDALVQATGRFCHSNFLVAKSIYEHSAEVLDMARSEFEHNLSDTVRENTAKYDRLLSTNSMQRVKFATDYHRRWSVVISHGFLGRILSAHAPSMALQQLANEASSDEELINYSITSCVSNTWRLSKVDKAQLQELVKKHGINSAFSKILRFCLYAFTKYLPIDDSEIEFLSSELGMSRSSLKSNQFVLRSASPKKLRKPKKK